MSAKIARTTTFEITECAQCGVEFAMPQHLFEQRLTNGGDFYCPNGHLLVFHEPEVEKLRKQNRVLAAQLTAERDQHRAAAGEIARQRKRSSAGVCPCCHRSFQQLRRHMSGQHPDYAES